MKRWLYLASMVARKRAAPDPAADLIERYPNRAPAGIRC
jgi:hypothetical protein